MSESEFVGYKDQQTVLMVLDLIDQLERKAVSLSTYIVEVNFFTNTLLNR